MSKTTSPQTFHFHELFECGSHVRSSVEIKVGNLWKSKGFTGPTGAFNGVVGITIIFLSILIIGTTIIFQELL